MTRELLRTAVAVYSDESVGVLRVSIVRMGDDPFVLIDAPDGDGGLVVGTAAQADALIEALQHARRETWGDPFDD